MDGPAWRRRWLIAAALVPLGCSWTPKPYSRDPLVRDDKSVRGNWKRAAAPLPVAGPVAGEPIPPAAPPR